jgi:HD superfamily phosphohydrolase
VEVRDPVHGSIHILPEEAPIIKAPFFQRLRNIKQLGFSEYVFPGATHTRFIHSIGVMNVGARAFEKLFANFKNNSELQRVKETFKLACLLHDIGHAPLSHTTEIVMPSLDQLGIPSEFLSEQDKGSKRRATHEDYTIKSIADSSFSESFKKIEETYGVRRKYIADLIRGKTDDPSYFSIAGVNYFPILHQLVSSELDCDRMDYLLRDSYFCGVSYGGYDLDWLLDNLEVCLEDGHAYIGITERAVVTFDDFLLSRYHMFVMVYFHYRAVCLEQLLYKYFETSPEEYLIPADIEKYIEHDDHFLMKIMRNSNNRYANEIVRNEIPAKVYESFNESQKSQLEEIQKYLASENIEYIRCSSRGRLSKYYEEHDTSTDYAMKVVRKFYNTEKKEMFNINRATDLFQKFSKSHEINRLHCYTETMTDKQKQELAKLSRQ